MLRAGLSLEAGARLDPEPTGFCEQVEEQSSESGTVLQAALCVLGSAVKLFTPNIAESQVPPRRVT